MKLNTESIFTIAVIAIIVIDAIALYIKLWREERAKNQEIYFDRYNSASAYLAFCKDNGDFRGEHYDKLIDMIDALYKMPLRNLEHVQTLHTEANRCFTKVRMQRHIDAPGFKKRRAKKIAKVEMINSN